MTNSAFRPAEERDSSAPTAGQRLVASFDTYATAQKLVDRMSDGVSPSTRPYRR
jgi:hypothetical protein